MNTLPLKLLDAGTLKYWRKYLRENQFKLVVASGCFDILHVGHVLYLEYARSLGDALLVGINADESVRALKGPGRPINTDCDRATVIAGLECVSKVFVFKERTAENFLRLAQCDVWIKGGDWKVDELDPGERAAVVDGGGKFCTGPFLSVSTTAIINKIRDNCAGSV